MILGRSLTSQRSLSYSEDAMSSPRLGQNAERAMYVALLCFGRWAFGDVDNDNNWILLGSKVFKRNGQSFHLGSQMK